MSVAHLPAHTSTAPPSEVSQFLLLRQRRFSPFFWTQFSGAANDSLFKFAITVMATYQLQIAWLPAQYAGLVISALFILPFVLFSATCGQLADKWPRLYTIKLVKNFELVIMAIACYGLLTQHSALLLLCVFLMGVHSTVFGPIKYAILPQVLSPRELVGGNGLIEMGTFIAILVGNMVGGLLITLPTIGPLTVAIVCLAIASFGRISAQFIPALPAADPTLQVNWNLFSETWWNVRTFYQDKVLFRSILGISWLWFFGGVYLSLFPSFAKETLFGDAHVASLLLALFSIGMGAGSLMCDRLSRRRVEIGLVPLGALGMSVFSIDLYLATLSLPVASPLVDIVHFVANPTAWRIMLDLTLLSVCAGIYSVPLYAQVQVHSSQTHRARTVANINIISSLFIIGSALFAGALLALGASTAEVFLCLGLVNALVAGAIFFSLPEYTLRCLAWLVANLLYYVRLRGVSLLPPTGGVLLIATRLGQLDPLLLLALIPRPVRFALDATSTQRFSQRWWFRLLSPLALERTADLSEALAQGQVIISFIDTADPRSVATLCQTIETLGLANATPISIKSRFEPSNDLLGMHQSKRNKLHWFSWRTITLRFHSPSATHHLAQALPELSNAPRRFD